MNLSEPQVLTRNDINQWPIEQSGLSARAVHCLAEAGVKTIGELRKWDDRQLLALRNFGVASLNNVHWFFRWADRLEHGTGRVGDFRALLREFLDRDEELVLEQRYGLMDPLFRPHMKRRTLQEIADMRGGVTRERVRQIEETALEHLRSRLCRALAEPQERYWLEQIQAQSAAVTSAELADWIRDPLLGGYQPWGALLLFTEAFEHISFRYDYFSSLPQHVLDNVEKQILQLLHDAPLPVPFEQILLTVTEDLRFLNGQRPRLVSVMLDHHPEISGTVDRRYFLPSRTASVVVEDILRDQPQPLHFHELTRLYNQRMLPHSQKGTGYILRVLNMMPDAQRVSRAVYTLKQ